MKRFCLLLLCSALLANGGLDWPQFRGPDRNGISAETGLLSQWPAEGPKEVWRVPLGDGYSAVSIVGDLLFTAYAIGEGEEAQEVVACFEAESGKQVWQVVMGPKVETEFGNGPRSTPTIDGDLLFMLSGTGDFVALKSNTGEKVWGFNIEEKYEVNRPGWGWSPSPLVVDDKVMLQVGGGENKAFVAFNKKTGEELWGSLAGGPSYNSIYPINMHGKDQYLCFQGGALVSLDDEGKSLWSHPWPRGETHASPIFLPPNRIYASGAEGVGAEVIEIPAGEAPTPTSVWKVANLRNHFSSSVEKDGFIYGFDNATFKCVSAEDGSLKWAKRGFGKGSLMMAEGKLYLLSDRGKLALVDTNPEKYSELGKVQSMGGRCWTAPTLSHGQLYVRNHSEMVRYDVQQ